VFSPFEEGAFQKLAALRAHRVRVEVVVEHLHERHYRLPRQTVPGRSSVLARRAATSPTGSKAANECERAHNRPMKIREQIKEWRRKRAAVPADADRKDFKTVGKTSRPSDAITSVPPSYFPKDDEGRPPH